MEVSGRTVLVTGGGSGIGLALAERFAAAGSRILACGRREDRLRALVDRFPGTAVRVCDVAQEEERIALAEWAVRQAPDLDVLVNNAGIQHRIRLDDPAEWRRAEEELTINLLAPIHLTMLLVPHLKTRPRAEVLNVTSGLSFVPLVNVPVYCATKAALHSLTLSLRRQLAGTPVRVVEVIPPAVDTDLGGPGLHTFGVPLGVFADEAFAALREGKEEFAYGFSAQSSRASREELDGILERLNAPR